MAMLTEELSHFPTFVKLLKVGDKRSCLHTMLQATVEKTSTPLPDTLAQAFCLDQEKLLAKLNSPSHNNLSVSNTSKTLELGFILGGFLCEAGWYEESVYFSVVQFTSFLRSGILQPQRSIGPVSTFCGV